MSFAVKGVLDLPEGKEVAIIGTLYKEMKLKPSILAEYTKVVSNSGSQNLFHAICVVFPFQDETATTHITS